MTEAVGVRKPLRDRSRQFRNTNSHVGGQTGTETDMGKPKQRVISREPITQQQHQQPFQVTHSTRPTNTQLELLGTSTPKKDGYVPFLMSNTTTTTEATTTTTAASKNQKVQTYEKELNKWQQTWRSILPSQHIYFEHDDTHDKDRKRSMLALKSLGATIEPFFDENITIIVSKRAYDKKFQYPMGDIFRIVAKKQIKVWSIEKVFRFMKHLEVDIPECSSQNDVQLESLLQNERIFGTNDRDPFAKRDDMKYFIGPHLYVYDLSQRFRPVIVKEWKDIKECTKINKSTNGKSIFVEESKSNSQASLLKRHKRRLQNLDECTSYRLQLEEACYPSDYPGMNRRSYDDRVEYAKEYLNNYYTKRPEEDPHIKYKGSGLADFFDELILKGALQNQKTLENKCVKNADNCNTNNRSNKILNMLLNEPDAIDEATRHKRVPSTKKKIDKLMFDIPLLPAPPPQVRRENSVFGTNFVQQQQQQQPQQTQQQLAKQLEQGNGKLLCEYGEIVASGVTQSGSNVVGGVLSQGSKTAQGNGLGPSRASATNRALLKDSKRTVVFPSATISIGRAGSNTIVMQQGNSTLPNENELESITSTSTNASLSLFNDSKSYMVKLKLPKLKLSKLKKQSPFFQLNNQIASEDISKLAPLKINTKKEKDQKKKHEMKPGYCENCRVKYTDFEDHILVESHRQFASNSKNFAEIDRLINKVSRRL